MILLFSLVVRSQQIQADMMTQYDLDDRNTGSKPKWGGANIVFVTNSDGCSSKKNERSVMFIIAFNCNKQREKKKSIQEITLYDFTIISHSWLIKLYLWDMSLLFWKNLERKIASHVLKLFYLFFWFIQNNISPGLIFKLLPYWAAALASGLSPACWTP